MEVLKALQTLATVDLKTDTELERTTKVRALRVVDEQLTQPLLRTTAEFDKLLEFGVYSLLRTLQDSDMNVWSLAEQVLVKTVKVLESTHRDKIVTEVWKGVKGSKVEGRSRRFAIELFALYSHRIKPSKADKFREALLRNLVSITRQEDDQLLQEALSKSIEPIITHQLAHAPLADLDPFLDELAANVRSGQGRVRRSAVSCIVALCRGHRQHLDLFVASTRRMLNLVLMNYYRGREDNTKTQSSNDNSNGNSNETTNTTNLLVDIPEANSNDTSNQKDTSQISSPSATPSPSSTPSPDTSTTPSPKPPSVLPELPLKPEILRKPITDLDLTERLSVAVSQSSSATLQGVMHCFRQLLRLDFEYVNQDVYAMPNPMNADIGTLARIASQSLRHEDNNVAVAALELLQEIFENNWQPLVQLGGTGFPNSPQKSEVEAFIEDIVAQFEKMLFDLELRISVQVLLVACFCSLALSLPMALQKCLKRRLSKFIDLLKHSDPLLRGQAYYFIGCFVSGWLQSKTKIDWPELDVFEILGTILNSTMQDDSAIAAKMACEGLSICVEPLLASEHAFFVPYMLQHLMCLPPDAYLLLKAKTFSLMSKIDYRMISFLEKSMKKLRATDYKPGSAGQQIQQQASLIDDVTQLVSSMNIPQAQTTPVVKLPVHLTIGPQKLQNSVVDFLISFLEDPDHRVRHKAGKVLVKLVPHISYSHFFDTAEKRQYVVALRILDMQTSQHMSSERNNEWKEHTDWLLWRLVPKINQAVESLFLKGFYHFLRILLEKGYTLPGQLIGVMLDQLACSNLATDLDTQLDVFVMMSLLVPHLKGSLAPYTQRVFVHVLRILHILSAILSGKPAPSFKETKPGTERDVPFGAVQGQPQYLQLWDRLQDTYRLSLTSLHGNLFDEFCEHSIKAVALIVKAMGKGVVPYVDELIGYLNDHFERNTEEVLDCLQTLLEAALSDVDLVQERSLASLTEGSNSAPTVDAVVHNIVEMTTPNYDSLLNPVVPSQRTANSSSLTRNLDAKREPVEGEPSSSPSLNSAATVKEKRKILKSFESSLKRCIDHYLSTQAVHRRRAILQLFTHIIATLGLTFDYRSLDRDAAFVRQVHGHLMRTSNLHNELTKSKLHVTASINKTPVRPSGSSSPLGQSTDSAITQSSLNEGTALQLSELAATQLAFLYEMLFHCGISWNGADLMGLIPLAFNSSWQPSSNQGAFEDIANILFTENLLKQWKDCPKHHTLGKPVRALASDRGSAPPNLTASPVRSSSGTLAPSSSSIPLAGASIKIEQKEDWISESVLGGMRNQFVTQLLMLIPDPRAIHLLAHVLNSLRSFKNSSAYLEISSVIHDGLITILLDEGTTVLFAKSSIRDLLSMFALLDNLPTKTINLDAIAATFVSISKLSLHHLESSVQTVQQTNKHEDLLADFAPSNPSIPSTPPSQNAQQRLQESINPISAIPRHLQLNLGAVTTPPRSPKISSPVPVNTSTISSRPLTPADLGIVSPLPMSPAHKEETLRERSKRRVVEHERRYYAAHDRAWLPRSAFLLRIISRFSESQILAALKNPLKAELADTLPAEVDLEAPTGIAYAFSLLLTSLLERGAYALSQGVSAEYYDDWTRQICILTHLVTYVVDSACRGAPSSEPLSPRSEARLSSSSSNGQITPIPAPQEIQPTTQQIAINKNLLFEDDESGEDLLVSSSSSFPTYYLPDAMKTVLSSFELTNLLYGAVQSKFSAVAFSLCKLFQNLNLANALQSVLAFTSPTPTKSSKSVITSLSSPRLSHKRSLSETNAAESASSSTTSLPWTWYREVLHMAAFSAYCRVTSIAANASDLSTRRNKIKELLANPQNLERITHQAHNSDIRRLFSLYPIEPEQIQYILNFVDQKLTRNSTKESMEPSDLHQLLLVTTYLPPSEPTLLLIFKHFITCPYISLVIAAEQYFYNLLSTMENIVVPQPTDGTEPEDSVVRRVINSKLNMLRMSFRKKLLSAKLLSKEMMIKEEEEEAMKTTAKTTSIQTSSIQTSTIQTSTSSDFSAALVSSPHPPDHSPSSLLVSSPHQTTITPRSTHNPSQLIEDFVLEYLMSKNLSETEYLNTLISSMSSRQLFRKILKFSNMKQQYLVQCLNHPSSSKVGKEILHAITMLVKEWIETHKLKMSDDLNVLLCKVEDQTLIQKRPTVEPKSLVPGPNTQSSFLSQTTSQTSSSEDYLISMKSAEDDHDGVIGHILASDWRANIQLLNIIGMAAERLPNILLPITAAVNNGSNGEEEHKDSLEVLIPQSEVGVEEAETIKSIQTYLGPSALVCLLSSAMRKLLHLHETKTSVLSSFDIIVVLKTLKHLFGAYHFSVHDLSTHPHLRRIIYRLYLIYFILFKPSKRMILDYSSSAQVGQVLQFFYEFVRTLAKRPSESENIGWSPAQSLFNETLQKLIQSSPSMEYAVFPLQDDPINFDYNNEPVELLEQFCYLINTIHFNYSFTFTAVWKQLMEGCDEEIASVATSEAIKLTHVRSMASMLLRAGYKANNIHVGISASAGEKGFNLGIPLLSLDTLRTNNNTSPKFVGLDLSNMLTVFINSLLKPFIEGYAEGTTGEPAVGKESLKSLILLSDHFTTPQWQWLNEYMFGVLGGQNEIWDEDPLMKSYVLLGAAKSTAVLWPHLQTKISTLSASQQPSTKLQKLIQFHIHNMKLREADIHSEDHTVMPVAKNLVLIAIHYIIQAKTIFDVRSDPVISPWIDACAKSAPGAQDGVEQANRIDSRVVAENTKASTSALVRFLAKSCQALLAHQSGRDMDITETIDRTALTSNEDDFDMNHMEEIKGLFGQARDKATPQLDELVSSIIPHKLMNYFNAETLISILLAELAKPEPKGVPSIAMILFQVLNRLRATYADTLDVILTRWVLMTLPHFTRNAASGFSQAPWVLTALFLASSRNPALTNLFPHLMSGVSANLTVDPKLFMLGGIDFLTDRDLDEAAKTDFINALNIQGSEIFQLLHQQLQFVQDPSKQTQVAQSAQTPNYLD